MAINNIVFDFGGVLLDLDVNRTYEALRQVMALREMATTFTNSIVIFLILLKWVTPSLKISFGSFKTRVSGFHL